jgi:putative ABC transport system ATP-binding protein
MSAVEIRNVAKVFKKEAAEIVALRETSLHIGQGDFLCLMGPSGSGKSTLLNLIAGIDRPRPGRSSLATPTSPK